MKPAKQDCRSILQTQGPEVLRAMAVDAEPFEPDGATVPPPERKPLSAFVVDHTSTLGMSWQEIDNLRPPFVIDQFLRRGEVLLLGAESKSRKSWLAQDAGFSVAAGEPWLADEDGQNGFATAQAAVHVLDLELNPAEMRYRFAKARGNRFADSPQQQAEVTAAFRCYSFDGLNVSDILPRLAEVQSTVQPGDLAIVDCLYRLAPDGNEVAPLAAILETVKRFAADTQAGVVVVDHFRKAGDDKARNRFAGSFIKQASASTLVAIETKPDDLLELNIDARTFFGIAKVHARFDLESYTFRRVPDSEVADAKQGREQAEADGWLVAVWKSRVLDYAATAADAGSKWGISRQGAGDRFKKLASRGAVARVSTPAGHACQWILTPEGAEIVKISLNLHP
ncbi:MAG: AAA family ATPase [Verrucomicrobia bacterium]|nr:AAA family ATPase [Verrucomicrobiota bacterium]